MVHPCLSLQFYFGPFLFSFFCFSPSYSFYRMSRSLLLHAFAQAMFSNWNTFLISHLPSKLGDFFVREPYSSPTEHLPKFEIINSLMWLFGFISFPQSGCALYSLYEWWPFPARSQMSRKSGQCPYFAPLLHPAHRRTQYIFINWKSEYLPGMDLIQAHFSSLKKIKVL